MIELRGSAAFLVRNQKRGMTVVDEDHHNPVEYDPREPSDKFPWSNGMFRYRSGQVMATWVK